MTGGEAGSPLPVLLAPGLLCDARLWADLRALLITPSCDVDFRQDVSLTAMAERILATGPERFVLAGFSMGGMAAILAAFQAPDRIAALIILSTHGRADDDMRRQARLDQVKRAKDAPFDRFCASLPSLYFSDPSARPTASRQVETMARDVGVEVFCRHVQALIDRPDISAAAQTLSVPTTVLSGANDRIAPASLGSLLAASIPGARFISIPDCGHMAPLERPDRVASVINGYALGAQREMVG